jgi:predicted dehydrogenase
MPRRVMAWTRTLAHTIAVEDMVEALFEYDSGAVARLACNTIDFTGSSRFEVWGYRAIVVVDSWGLRIARPDVPGDEFIRSSGKAWGEPVTAQEIIEPEKPLLTGHTAVIYDFSQALLEGRPPAVTGQEGRNSLELANAIVLSSRRGKVVELPLDRAEYDELLAELQAGETRR